MDIFNVSTFIFLMLVICKILIFHGLKNLQRKTWFMDNICVNGYYGYCADPFDCDSYYKCPERIKFFCEPGTQFDPDKSLCVPLNSPDGCFEIMRRRLLM